MSLWANYIAERLGHSIIEKEWGFLSYRLNGEDCEIMDVYVEPDFRLKGHWRILADEVSEIAKREGAKRLLAAVWIGTNGAELSLKVQLGFGFKLHSADVQRIILAKELGD